MINRMGVEGRWEEGGELGRVWELGIGREGGRGKEKVENVCVCVCGVCVFVCVCVCVFMMMVYDDVRTDDVGDRYVIIYLSFQPQSQKQRHDQSMY